MHPMVITAAEAVTPVGSTAVTTAASIRAGISRLGLHDLYLDVEGNPLSVAVLPNDEGFADPVDRMGPAAIQALHNLMRSFDPVHDRGRPCHLLLGGAGSDRDGQLYRAAEDLLPAALASELEPLFASPRVRLFPRGNPSAMFALVAALEILQRDPRSVCIVGAADSLLNEDLLERLEEDERLGSEGYDCPHVMSPGEAVAFMVVESARMRSPRASLATIEGVAVAFEPHPYLRPEPTLGEGIADVCRRSLIQAGMDGTEVDAVLIDLDGEHHRAVEWSYAEVRCLGDRQPPRKLLHPADGYGSIGAASGAVLMATVAASRGWLDGRNLVLASDDYGPRGAAVLRRQWKGT